MGELPDASKSSQATLVQPKVARQTRQRILDLSLRLFNEFGEPNVTTTVIADGMKISPGNLYYHFRNKEDIVDSIFVDFNAKISQMLALPEGRHPTMEDVWQYLHQMFELVWRYRFFYRDLSDLLSRNRNLELQFKQIFAHKIKVAKQLCEGMRQDGQLEAGSEVISVLSTNMVVVSTYWLSYEYVLNPRRYAEPDAMEAALQRGCHQVSSLMRPYLRGASSEAFNRLAQRLNSEQQSI